MADPAERAIGQSTIQEMEITEQEIAHRKKFLEFYDEDIARLLEVNDIAQGYAQPVIESFYDHLLAFEETRAFFPNPGILAHVKNMQREYFLRLTQGNYDAAYVENRLRIGAVHERIGLPIKSYLGMYSFYLRAVASQLLAAYKEEPQRTLPTLLSLMKLVFLDIGLAIDTYIFQRERTIRIQQETIREIPTPVLQVRERLLIVPIIGVLDSTRARRLTDQLLRAIRANRARVVVLDITGVPAVDSRVASHLLQTIDASRLMGATVIVTGLSAEVAQTLVAIGVDMTKLNTVGDLQGGIEEADQLLGYKVVRIEEPRGRQAQPEGR
jgi:rsbT co-antagonist protein RsbR